MFAKFFSSIAALGFGFAISCASSASVIHITDSQGKLLGATGVMVDGKSYSVQFMDGSCRDLYNGCDSPNDFLFNTSDLAVMASQALLDTVFINDFDKFPALTRGCSNLGVCAVMTAFDTYLTSGSVRHIGYAYAGNYKEGGSYDDMAYFSYYDYPVAASPFDSSNVDLFTGAVWSADDIATVPEPSSLTLFALSAVALIWSRRRRIGARAQ